MSCMINGHLEGRSNTTSKHLVLQINDCIYAVKIPFIRKVIALSHITPQPLTAAHMLGIIKEDGTVYAVTDLRILFGAKPEAVSLPSTAVLLEYENKNVVSWWTGYLHPLTSILLRRFLL